MTPSTLLLIALALIGHTLVWTRGWDLLNALYVGGKRSHQVSHALVAAYVAIPPLLAAVYALAPGTSSGATAAAAAASLIRGYVLLTAATAVVSLPVVFWYRWRYRESAALLHRRSELVDVAARLGGRPARSTTNRILTALPGNEALTLEVSEKSLHLPQLDPRLEGLVIAHLSDLHLSGGFDRSFYDEVVSLVNQMHADLVAVTGDLADRDECVGWLPSIFGRCQAKHARLYVLGNHDMKVDTAALHSAMSEAGFRYVGGTRRTVEARGVPVRIAGNEHPWFPAPASTRSAVSKAQPTSSAETDAALRLLLAHSPDVFPWAAREGFDLMLAGHTHGGQIRLPGYGCVVSCSRYGSRYVAGVHQRLGCLLHTSRGVSGLQPLRFGCPPELTKLILTREKAV